VRPQRSGERRSSRAPREIAENDRKNQASDESHQMLGILQMTIWQTWKRLNFPEEIAPRLHFRPDWRGKQACAIHLRLPGRDIFR